ncbi:MAG: hypothetical protein IBX69_00215 [Anaerolineales bacterium]|nr:hypothetical protein [Anaerolineales bacterium]
MFANSFDSHPLFDEVEKLLQDAANAHHDAYLATDGFDPEWPIWYAEYLLEPLSSILQVSITKSELVYLLVRMDKEQSEIPAGEDWYSSYTNKLLKYFS